MPTLPFSPLPDHYDVVAARRVGDAFLAWSEHAASRAIVEYADWQEPADLERAVHLARQARDFTAACNDRWAAERAAEKAAS